MSAARGADVVRISERAGPFRPAGRNVLPQVQRPVVRLRKRLKPLVGGLDVDGAPLGVALSQQIRHDLATHEVARSAVALLVQETGRA